MAVDGKKDGADKKKKVGETAGAKEAPKPAAKKEEVLTEA